MLTEEHLGSEIRALHISILRYMAQRKAEMSGDDGGGRIGCTACKFG
jgi:hypothetical protein